MYYPDELVEEVRSKNDIVDVISGYVHLQKKGANHWGCCPFHNEKTPSFSVNGAKQMYHCFGCGVSGNVYTFMMSYENMTFPEAVQHLAQNAGVELPHMEETREMKERRSERERILELNKAAATYFYYQIRDPKGEIAMDYLKKRELSDETIKNFGLGYSGKSGSGLIQYLKQKGFEDKLIVSAGIGTFSERAGLGSLFWNRVMYPIFDIHGKVIGFGGRVMGDGEPKYLNSPESPVFDKRRNLYGLHLARKSRADYFILCEGYMDVIAMHQAGFNMAVASLGTAFTNEQAALLKKYTENIYLAYDSDGAGVKAALRAIGILRQYDLTGKIINMRPYKDPDEFMKALGREEFENRIKNAENSFMFEIRMLKEGYNLADPTEKTKFFREVAQRICGFSEALERDTYMQAIAEQFNVKYEDLQSMVRNIAANNEGIVRPTENIRSGLNRSRNPEENPTLKCQRFLLTWLTDEPDVIGKIKRYITPDDFTEALYQEIAVEIYKSLEGGSLNPAQIISRYTDPEEQSRVAEVFQSNIPALETKAEKEKALHDVVYAVKENSYNNMMGKIGNDISALSKMVEGKKALEELAKMHFSL